MLNIEADYLRAHGRLNRLKMAGAILLNPCFMAVAAFRWSHWFWEQRISGISALTTNIVRLLTGINIEFQAEIGPGLKISHGVGTVIGGGCRIGRDFSIGSGAVLGGNHRRHRIDQNNRRVYYPVIGDHVIVNAGAKVLGPVIIGDFVMIGANAVVTEDIPSYTLVAPPKARVMTLGEGDPDLKRYFPGL